MPDPARVSAGVFCSACGHTAVTGTGKMSCVKPPPPELANQTFLPTPPDLLERTSGVQIDDLSAELEHSV